MVPGPTCPVGWMINRLYIESKNVRLLNAAIPYPRFIRVIRTLKSSSKFGQCLVIFRSGLGRDREKPGAGHVVRMDNWVGIISIIHRRFGLFGDGVVRLRKKVVA